MLTKFTRSGTSSQPLPNPLSWYLHHLPRPLHRVEGLANHVAQLIVPFGLFAPQPVAGVAGAVIVATQSWLVLSGNFSWLNAITIALAVAAFDDPHPRGTGRLRTPRCPVSARAG